MDFSVPVLLAGIACGLLSGAPYMVALFVARKRRDASILPALVAVCVSVVVIALSVLVGWLTVPGTLLVFAIALVVAFFAMVIASVVMFGRKPRP